MKIVFPTSLIAFVGLVAMPWCSVLTSAQQFSTPRLTALIASPPVDNEESNRALSDGDDCLGQDAALAIVQEQIGIVTAVITQLAQSGTPTQEAFVEALNALDPIVYKICPGTTITSGVSTGAIVDNLPVFDPPFSFPFLILVPKVTIQCGENGDVNDNCIMQHGQNSIITLPGFPGVPPAFQFRTDDLLVKGITFRGYHQGAKETSARRNLSRHSSDSSSKGDSSEAKMTRGAKARSEYCNNFLTDKALFVDESNFPRTGVALYAPADRVVVEDCLFIENEGLAVIAGGKVDFLGVDASPDSIGVAVKDSVVKDSIIFDGVFGSSQQTMTVENTLVQNVTSCFLAEGGNRLSPMIRCQAGTSSCTLSDVRVEGATFDAALVSATESKDKKLPTISAANVRIYDVNIEPIGYVNEACSEGLVQIDIESCGVLAEPAICGVLDGLRRKKRSGKKSSSSMKAKKNKSPKGMGKKRL